jgi:hypothetical protein
MPHRNLNIPQPFAFIFNRKPFEIRPWLLLFYLFSRPVHAERPVLTHRSGCNLLWSPGRIHTFRSPNSSFTKKLIFHYGKTGFSTPKHWIGPCLLSGATCFHVGSSACITWRCILCAYNSYGVFWPVVYITWVVQWSKLALSKGPNRVSPSPHLRTQSLGPVVRWLRLSISLPSP